MSSSRMSSLIKDSPIKEPSKVYLLTKFAYSFQRRLRELATPKEACHLQLADVDDTVPLKPLINCSNSGEIVVWDVKSQHVCLTNLLETETTESDMLTLHSLGVLKVISADTNSFRRPFYQLYDLPPALFVKNSTINDAFFAQYANVYKHYVCDNSLVLKLEDSKLQIENIFNQIQECKIPLAVLLFENSENFDWVKLLLKCKECPLQLLRFSGLFDDIFGNVNGDDLAKMFRSIGRRLRVHVGCKTESYADIKDRLNRVLGKKFVTCSKGHPKWIYFDLVIVTSTERRFYISKQALSKPCRKKMVL
uniref:F-box domain-containing protein n=1 Tax=Panagrellus redivivus TaxID=6233 RepID=A0A7E4W8U9_PANRE